MATFGGTNGDDTINGTSGNDTIFGGGGNDTLNGLGGDDTINDDSGNDMIDGGDGNDTITDLGGIGRIDGGNGDDTIYLGTRGSDQTFRIQVFGGDGYDTLVIRSAAGRYVNLAASSLESVSGGIGDDFFDGSGQTVDLQLFGGSGNNRLIGGAGNDRIEANPRIDSGNDVLNGNAGSDIMIGGSGNDTYHVDDLGDRVNDYLGFDTIISSISVNLSVDGIVTLDPLGYLSTIENLYLSGEDDIDAIGNYRDNVLKGNAGNNTLNGRAGDDLLFGNDGNDILYDGEGLHRDRMLGGAGDDVYHVDSIYSRVFETTTLSSGVDAGGFDRVVSSVSYSIADGLDGRQFIEKLRLIGNEDIDATGNGLDNILIGNDGNNAISGRAGDDLIIGGEGQDTLTGGSGSDTFQFADLDFGGNTVLTADIITDFGAGDVIDLHFVDAIPGTLANDRFAFIGSGAFNGVRGELRFEQFGGDTYVQGDTNGDGYSDFVIRLSGAHTLVAADFML